MASPTHQITTAEIPAVLTGTISQSESELPIMQQLLALVVPMLDSLITPEFDFKYLVGKIRPVVYVKDYESNEHQTIKLSTTDELVLKSTGLVTIKVDGKREWKDFSPLMPASDFMPDQMKALKNAVLDLAVRKNHLPKVLLATEALNNLRGDERRPDLSGGPVLVTNKQG